ncbi:MAG TPA: thioesterase family protein [Thermoleophilaceae bacterium]|nr:thioesterase family protein [Thermoleophilaceae bacterium]
MGFEHDTAVRRTADGGFEADIPDERWWVAAGPHGGFVAAIVVNALTAALDDPARPIRSLTIHYPAAPRVGKLEIAVSVERVGRSTAYLSARVEQGGRLVALALAAFSSAFPGPDFQTAAMPDVPPPEEVEPQRLPGAPRFTHNFEYRFAIGGPPFQEAEHTTSGGWLRLAEPRPLDAPIAACFTDAWPPAVFWRLSNFAIVPTIDLTVHFRELPEGYDDFVLATFDSRREHAGMWEENGELWSRDGRLLVQSRQLAAHIPFEATAS